LATSIREEIFADIDIPDMVTVRMEGNLIVVGGKLGTLQKDLTKLPISVDIKDKKTGDKTSRYKEKGFGYYEYCKKYHSEYD